MRLGLRLLFGFFLITGLAAYFVLRVVVAEVKPSVREVMEDILVDSANLLAEQAAPDLQTMPAGGTLVDSRFARSVADYAARPVDVQIWGLRKQSLDFRVYVTDASGRVVFDSGTPTALGQDFSRWRDVLLTLRGSYGARASRDAYTDGTTTIMYVAAPIKQADQVIGVLTVAKPIATVQQFIDRAEHKILTAGAWLLGVSLAIGVAVTAWIVHSVRQLRRYAQQARAGERQPVPDLPGELGELAQAMDAMRDRLEGQQRVEQLMRGLTHELKSPLTAIAGAAELLQDDLPEADRHRFALLVDTQAQRLRTMVDRMLELSKLEGLRAPVAVQRLSLHQLVQEQVAALQPLLAQRRLHLRWAQQDEAPVMADAQRLGLAVANLLGNAVDFAPESSLLELAVVQRDGQAEFHLRDHGPGVADFALPQLGQRFFSTPRPRDGAKGSGLGLAITLQVAALHGGRVAFEPAAPGLRVTLFLPATH